MRTAVIAPQWSMRWHRNKLHSIWTLTNALGREVEIGITEAYTQEFTKDWPRDGSRIYVQGQAELLQEVAELILEVAPAEYIIPTPGGHPPSIHLLAEMRRRLEAGGDRPPASSSSSCARSSVISDW